MRNEPSFRPSIFILSLLLSVHLGTSQAAPLNLVDSPLFVSASASPLAMLVMGRDHKLYYEAYNDASDLNNDGIIDVGYQPAIEYFGYFDSHLCYQYSSNVFSPSGKTDDKKCNGSKSEWSGDFLNYVTTARIDALRKVLYGGFRSVDTNNKTILQRTHIPQDAHAWGKAYDPQKDNHYSITDYTPLPEPNDGKRHLFANVSLSYDGQPLMRVLNNTQYNVWDWVSIERPVAGNDCLYGGNSCATGSSTISNYSVNIEVCLSDESKRSESSNCQKYSNGNYKPTGLLQQYGENDSIMFGLFTGSYQNNLQGGVLRKNISSLTDEVNSGNGTFKATVGIIKTIDKLRTYGFNYNTYPEFTYKCGWITNRAIKNGECTMWGNPIGEIMYESLRYFAGENPTPEFLYSSGSIDESLGLPLATWKDPYDTYGHCAKPFQLVISDINPSYDSDSLPGSAFSSWTDSDLSLNVQDEAAFITAGENGIVGKRFIGESKDDPASSATPAPKMVTSLGRIRGIAPEEPTKQGSYYSAAAAYYGWKTDLNSAIKDQRLNTFTVALASPLPEIKIPVTGGKYVTLIPFAKSPNGSAFGNSIDSSPLGFQPTNQIVDFYIESLDATSGSFLVNFEDVEQGADHDMDAIAKYSYSVEGNIVTISMESLYAAGSIDQHMGYVISGTAGRDGVYLEIKDKNGSDVNYYLDTPPPTYSASGVLETDGIWAGGRGPDTRKLGLKSTRKFTAGSTSGVSALKGPLWYAAKWGGFTDHNNNNLPDQTAEWDENGDGDPDNYFLVTNALNLSAQLKNAFDEITSRTGSSSTVAVNSGSLGTDTLLYQAKFDTEDWSGSLLALPIALDASLSKIPTWDAKDKIQNQHFSSGREILSYNTTTKKGIAFRWPTNSQSPLDKELAQTEIEALLINVASDKQSHGEDILNYIRGDQSNESNVISNTRNFRNRTTVLGDIIHSNPLYVGPPSFFLPDKWDSIEGINPPENSALQKYSDFRALFKTRTPTLYFGANDGMLHAVNATKTTEGGKELFAYVPSPTYPNLAQLTRPSYNHQYFVDGPAAFGDTFFSNSWHTVLVGTLRAGGQGIFALDISNPSKSTSGTYPGFDESNASKLVLWEFTDADDADLGYTYGQPNVVRMANGKWAAVFGNGYNNTAPDNHISGTGNAVIFIVNIENGALIAKLDTGTLQDPLGTDRPNGISGVSPVDINGDNIIDYLYAGDLFGNVWKFDVSSAHTSNWKSAFLSGATPIPLYTAKDDAGNSQPITSRVQVSTHPKFKTSTDIMVYFGTGKYLEASDTNASGETTQSFYGLWDNGSVITNRTKLLAQTIVEERSTPPFGSLRFVSDNPINWNIPATHRGWHLDLINTGNGSTSNKGERQVSNSIIRNSRIIFTTLIPTGDACDAGGTGWLMELDPNNGGVLSKSPIDTNGDGKIDDNDLLTAGIMLSGGGIPSAPIIIDLISSQTGPYGGGQDEDTLEKKFMSTSTGSIESVLESGATTARGRQSWREIK